MLIGNQWKYTLLVFFTGILGKKPQIIVKEVQQQYGAADCGVFAVAFAVSLARKNNPQDLRLNQPAMRKHLVLCLRNRVMLPFPEVKAQGEYNPSLFYCILIIHFARRAEGNQLVPT